MMQRHTRHLGLGTEGEMKSTQRKLPRPLRVYGCGGENMGEEVTQAVFWISLNA